MLLTLDQVASQLKLSPRTIRRLLEKNALPFAMKIQGSWRFQEKDVANWLENNKVSECFNTEDIDQLLEGCTIFNERIGVLMSLLKPLSKLPLSLNSQKMLLDLLFELFENIQGNIYLHHLEIKNLYEYVILHLDEEITEHVYLIYHKLHSIYRKTLYNKNQAREILVLLERRFPYLKNKHENCIQEIIKKITDINLGDFLNDCKISISEFERHFPQIYEIFIHPLKDNSVYHSIPLYIFYCNPVFFGWFFSYLSNRDKNGRAKEFIERLEAFLQMLPKVLDEDNRRIFLQKIDEVVRSNEKSSLTEISDKAYGVYAEILYLEKLAPKMLEDDFFVEHIKIPSQAIQKNMKICDFRLFGKNKDCRIIEIKGKFPGHGVDGSLGILNDFFINYSPNLVTFLHYVCPDIDVLELFPSLVYYEPAEYEIPTIITKFIFRQRVIDRNLSRNKMKKPQEQQLIKDILRSLFDAHIPLSMGERIGDDEERLQEKKASAESLFEKEFIKNTISNAFEKFRIEKRLAQQALLTVNKYALHWFLSIPSSLLVDPYSEEVGLTLTLREHIQQRIIKDCFKEVRSKLFPDFENELVELVFMN